MSKEEIYQVQTDQVQTDHVPKDQVSPRESLLSDENEYLELRRLRTLSSGRYGDEDSDYNEEVHYYKWKKVLIKLLKRWMLMWFQICTELWMRHIYTEKSGESMAQRCMYSGQKKWHLTKCHVYCSTRGRIIAASGLWPDAARVTQTETRFPDISPDLKTYADYFDGFIPMLTSREISVSANHDSFNS